MGNTRDPTVVLIIELGDALEDEMSTLGMIACALEDQCQDASIALSSLRTRLESLLHTIHKKCKESEACYG